MKDFRRSATRLAPVFFLLALVSCSGEPAAPTPPKVATTLAANSSISLAGIAGGAVTPPPSVIVYDQDGSPMGGATVTFAVVSGGGSATGASVTTDASGIATVGSWTLGPAAGENVLRATSGTLEGVVFAATSVAGGAASLARNAGDNQSAVAGTAVPVPPSVVVKDANGNPKSDVPVAFAVVSGGGSITGAAAVTNASGIATVGSWTLGNSAGANTLSATVAGLPPVTFTAAAISNLCSATSTHTFGTSTSGTFSSDDCRLSDGSFIDFYTTSIPQAGAYFFRQTAAFDTYLLLAMPDGTTIGENDDEDQTGTNSGFKALLPAGSYLLGPGTFEPGVTGDYTITSATAANDVTGCELVFVVRNVTTAQNLGSGDCNVANPGATPAYADAYFIFLDAGASVTINMSSSALDSFLQVVRLDGLVLAENDNADAATKNSRITFTAPQANYYAIFTRAVPASALGAYTLTIQ
ncbi:MAG: hypothetical protein ACSLFK_05110 [Gemmatimonadaceae bacterium]